MGRKDKLRNINKNPLTVDGFIDGSKEKNCAAVLLLAATDFATNGTRSLIPTYLKADNCSAIRSGDNA